MSVMHGGRTFVALNTHGTPTAAFVRNLADTIRVVGGNLRAAQLVGLPASRLVLLACALDVGLGHGRWRRRGTQAAGKKQRGDPRAERPADERGPVSSPHSSSSSETT